ncbi:hypothetical protein B0H13DRAFT_2311609 [Mycena leptocephala]|nr:hypothetical protein B0H13DRAFT_2311609 [Mycena leptocephala]
MLTFCFNARLSGLQPVRTLDDLQHPPAIDHTPLIESAHDSFKSSRPHLPSVLGLAVVSVYASACLCVFARVLRPHRAFSPNILLLAFPHRSLPFPPAHPRSLALAAVFPSPRVHSCSCALPKFLFLPLYPSIHIPRLPLPSIPLSRYIPVHRPPLTLTAGLILLFRSRSGEPSGRVEIKACSCWRGLKTTLHLRARVTQWIVSIRCLSPPLLS